MSPVLARTRMTAFCEHFVGSQAGRGLTNVRIPPPPPERGTSARTNLRRFDALGGDHLRLTAYGIEHVCKSVQEDCSKEKYQQRTQAFIGLFKGCASWAQLRQVIAIVKSRIGWIFQQHHQLREFGAKFWLDAAT